MLSRLHEIFLDLLVKWDCKLVEFNGEENHIHLLFQYHPDLQISTLVNNLKSVSSRRLRQEFADRVDGFYRKDVLWNGSYFIASCGGVTVSTLRKYIENQDSPTEWIFARLVIHPPICQELRLSRNVFGGSFPRKACLGCRRMESSPHSHSSHRLRSGRREAPAG